MSENEENSNEITDLPQLYANKTIYLIEVDLVNKTTSEFSQFYLTNRWSQKGNFIEILGYKVSQEALYQTTNKSAIALAKQELSQLVEIHFPYNKINSIINITYFQRNLDKDK
jgi:hypothetical protein